MPLRFAALLLTALALQACGSPKATDITTDPATALHDIWALEALDGATFTPAEGTERPTLELNLTDMRASGTDGCNRYMAPVITATANALTLGSLAGTKMICPAGMADATAFTAALAQTVNWRRTGLKLALLDASGESLMVLRKVD